MPTLLQGVSLSDIEVLSTGYIRNLLMNPPAPWPRVLPLMSNVHALAVKHLHTRDLLETIFGAKQSYDQVWHRYHFPRLRRLTLSVLKCAYGLKYSLWHFTDYHLIDSHLPRDGSDARRITLAHCLLPHKDTEILGIEIIQILSSPDLSTDDIASIKHLVPTVILDRPQTMEC